MSNEEIREKINDLIENLNDEGIKRMSLLVDVMENFEIYDKRTSLERLAVLQAINEEAKEEKKVREAEMLNEKTEKEKYKEIILNKHFRFLNKIDTVDLGNYTLPYDQMRAIVEKNNHLLLDTAVDFFKVGFIKGQNSVKGKRKKIIVSRKEIA